MGENKCGKNKICRKISKNFAASITHTVNSFLPIYSQRRTKIRHDCKSIRKSVDKEPPSNGEQNCTVNQLHYGQENSPYLTKIKRPYLQQTSLYLTNFMMKVLVATSKAIYATIVHIWPKIKSISATNSLFDQLPDGSTSSNFQCYIGNNRLYFTKIQVHICNKTVYIWPA
jgi:hypothetical protein